MPTRSYRCSNCLDHAVSRDFTVSHLSTRCESCGEFGRFVQASVIDRYERLDADPPADFAWDRLGRLEKLFVAERLTRSGATLDDFDVEEFEG